MKGTSTYRIGLILLTALPAAGQQAMMTSSNFSGGPDGMHGSATFRIIPYRQVIANAPYSGEEVTESKQTLIDGTNITRQMPRGAKTWRDSLGRVRTEENRGAGMMMAENNGVPTFVQISDPVGGYVYVLDSVNRVAHRVQIGEAAEGPPNRASSARGAAGGASTSASMALGGGGGVVGGTLGAISGGGGGAASMGQQNRQRPEMTTEDLGTRTIDGVTVTGTRRTTIIPEGAQGNDRPMTTTSEVWRSKELQLTLLSVNYSPAGGTQTTKYRNFSASEPDPSLFTVPSDYSIVDEKESFTIKWGAQ